MEKYLQLRTLTDSPYPYTVMEWRYAIFIKHLYGTGS